MTATASLIALVGTAMKPHAARGGYRKDKLNYRRRWGDALQVINVQLSQGNSADEARCYVNVGIAFDAVFALEGKQAPPALKEYEAHYRARLEDLVPGAPPHWSFTAATNPAALELELGAALARVAEFLDAVDGPTAMLARAPLDRGAENDLRAQLRYVLGDLDEALAAVRASVAFFADRGATVEKTVRKLRLEKLAERG